MTKGRCWVVVGERGRSPGLLPVGRSAVLVDERRLEG